MGPSVRVALYVALTDDAEADPGSRSQVSWVRVRVRRSARRRAPTARRDLLRR
jgi:hypothetical protein